MPPWPAAAEVVIVGAGIAGLATALALRRVGVARGVVVLERHPELRATGAALSIFPNGWFALRALGVEHKLTSLRDALLEALAEELPPGTIRFSSKLVSIDAEAAAGDNAPRTTTLRLDDGTVIRAKGVHSVVARWLGLSEPVSCGRSAVRGLAVYPSGHGLKRELRQFLSEGLRAGMMPVSSTHVY
ncbi:hypothetical protein C2845_PM01G35870 [Panicum miliaceum]|uniref:FAD dependent oxidoreductase domain-containing protein n=1 Tax=Panicum miliaceum TaxID=4540 RepID=A0A3L6TKL2_PANMI|nr:hypothetical protein C2845_PM01G35870 [Panicum miliaceum]